MDWILGSIGIFLILFGLIIWRFRLVDLLSNVDGRKVLDKEKATRLTFYYLVILGSCFLLVSYFIEEMSERTLMLTLACFIPVNTVVLVFYMVAQSRNMK
ncbi:hypothetical protein GCM10027347_04720 [Larkinella harenae]